MTKDNRYSEYSKLDQCFLFIDELYNLKDQPEKYKKLLTDLTTDQAQIAEYNKKYPLIVFPQTLKEMQKILPDELERVYPSTGWLAEEYNNAEMRNSYNSAIIEHTKKIYELLTKDSLHITTKLTAKTANSDSSDMSTKHKRRINLTGSREISYNNEVASLEARIKSKTLPYTETDDILVTAAKYAISAIDEIKLGSGSIPVQQLTDGLKIINESLKNPKNWDTLQKAVVFGESLPGNSRLSQVFQGFLKALTTVASAITSIGPKMRGYEKLESSSDEDASIEKKPIAETKNQLVSTMQAYKAAYNKQKEQHISANNSENTTEKPFHQNSTPKNN